MLILASEAFYVIYKEPIYEGQNKVDTRKGDTGQEPTSGLKRSTLRIKNNTKT